MVCASAIGRPCRKPRAVAACRGVMQRRPLVSLLAALVALGSLGATVATASSQAPRGKIPAHTFIDLVSGVPANIDLSAPPDQSTIALIPTWSSPLLRPRGGAPGTQSVGGPAAFEP